MLFLKFFIHVLFFSSTKFSLTNGKVLRRHHNLFKTVDPKVAKLK